MLPFLYLIKKKLNSAEVSQFLLSASSMDLLPSLTSLPIDLDISNFEPEIDFNPDDSPLWNTQDNTTPSSLEKTSEIPDASRSPKKRRKGVTPVQKLTKNFRRALLGVNEPVFPPDFVLTKKCTVYIRDCFQLFAQELCTNANSQHTLLYLYFQAAGTVCHQRDEAYKFLLSFFSNNRQVSQALQDLDFYTDNGEITPAGVVLLKRILWYYHNKI